MTPDQRALARRLVAHECWEWSVFSMDVSLWRWVVGLELGVERG